MGQSRGGLTGKIHALVDASSSPIKLNLSEGQAYNGRHALHLLSDLPSKAIVMGDRAYDADANRDPIWERMHSRTSHHAQVTPQISFL